MNKKTKTEWNVCIRTGDNTYCIPFDTEEKRNNYFEKIKEEIQQEEKILDIDGYFTKASWIKQIYKNHFKFKKTILGWRHID